MIKRLLSLLLSLFVTVAVAMSQTLTPAQVTKLKSLSPTQVTQLQNSVNQTTNTTQTKKNSVDSKRDAEVDPEAKEKDKELISQKEDLIESGIKIFGHDIFRKQNLTFAPSLNLPTPSNYILAAGDELNINIWGAAEENYKVVVSPDGNIQIPNVGLIQLSGVSIKMAEGRIKAHLMQKVEGLRDGSVFINVSLGNIRSIKVNIVGEAQAPGTYTLPSLATLFNALYVAGGVNNIGSLRNIKLYRRGALVASLDVYDYLLDGKQDVDMRLEDDDMIMIEPYANMVTVVGGVKRPMTYEMLKNETLATLISYSGGFRGDS
ncbi:MAG: SLBB domain-containing protein, partial [Mucinivorans sp.]